jgi:3-oxoacyl-[acyl-carrier protein] reductase
MDLGLAGKRAAVAAASSGLGFAAAQALVDEGVRVAICGRTEATLAEARARLGADAVAFRADVSTMAGATEFVSRAAAELGHVDILITNSGGPPPGTFATTKLGSYATALEQNLLSVVAMCTAAVPAMRERRWGRIVAISSITVRQPRPMLMLSNTARAGTTGFLKTLATEVARDGVTVNTLLPAYHNTDRLRELHGTDPEKLARMSAELPMGRLGEPAEFASFVAYLCGIQAGFVTGTAIQVDGGFYPGLL